MAVYVGVDPGLRGGIAALETRGGVVAYHPMPVAGGEVHAAGVADVLRRLVSLDAGAVAHVAIEKVGSMPAQGVASTFSFGVGCGRLHGVCATLGLPITLVLPTMWKKRVLIGLPHDKDGAIRFCANRWPIIDLVPPNGRVPHDGIADALCLAEYARLVL